MKQSSLWLEMCFEESEPLLKTFVLFCFEVQKVEYNILAKVSSVLSVIQNSMDLATYIHSLLDECSYN